MAAINFNVNSSSRFVSVMEQRQYYSRSVHTHTHIHTHKWSKTKNQNKKCVPAAGGTMKKVRDTRPEPADEPQRNESRVSSPTANCGRTLLLPFSRLEKTWRGPTTWRIEPIVRERIKLGWSL